MATRKLEELNGEDLLNLRKAWKLTVEDFAKLIGVCEVTVYRYSESRRYRPSLAISRIIKAFIKLNEDDQYIKNCVQGQIDEYGHEKAFWNLINISLGEKK